MAHDELDTRRWFRRRLKVIAEAHPELKDPDRQKACDQWLEKEDNDHADPERPEARKRRP
jgi:hypothetical protein